VRLVVLRRADINELTARGILVETEQVLAEGLVAMTGRPRTYRAAARRSGQWGAVTVPELRGVFTQARRLDQAAEMAREAVALYLDVGPGNVHIVVEPVLPDRAADSVAKLQRARLQAQRASDELAAAQAAAVRELVGVERLSNRDAAAVLGISHQRISQLSRSAHQAAG
jgi:DNA-directed RNA polymerase specialized sigma24 family protein